jgi:hypothetical protein
VNIRVMVTSGYMKSTGAIRAIREQEVKGPAGK